MESSAFAHPSGKSLLYPFMQRNSFFYQALRFPVLGLSIGFLLLSVTGFAQSLYVREEEVFRVVENPPEFPGGVSALTNYMQQTVKYPSEAQKAGVKDRLYVSFIVEKDGSLTDVQRLNSLGYGCDEEAVRVVKAMPRWQPGSQSGISGNTILRVKYNLPIFFNLDYTYYPRPTKY